MSTKIKLKQLRPNPFRDLTRYPIQRKKVEALKASIRTTGFWDNVLTRRMLRSIQRVGDECFEIAYGHHRLQALHELVKEQVIDEDYELELPVRNLDDAAMLRIMAGENLDEWGGSAEVSDETVRVTRDYIARETRTPLGEISAADISQFLSGGWNEDRVGTSLSRLGLYDRGVLKVEDVAGMSFSAARKIQRAAARVEKAVVRERLDEAGDMSLDAPEREKIRAEAGKQARAVATALSQHTRKGGAASQMNEVSFDTQVEQLAAGKSLGTIDAAARSVNAREFQRKIELLVKYKNYMSIEAKHELLGTLKEVSGWCKQIAERLDE